MLHLPETIDLPALPTEADDNLIHEQGIFPQTHGTCDIAGFTGCVKLFPLLAECLRRASRVKQRKRQKDPLSRVEVAAELDWIEQSRGRLDSLLGELPENLKQRGSSVADTGRVLGMQIANITVTETALRVAMVRSLPNLPMLIQSEFRAELSMDQQGVREEWLSLGRAASQSLSNIPLDQLGANGQSIVSHCGVGFCD